MCEIECKQALNFLICCYFGQSEDLGRAAIDRAYVDMAAHTLRIESNDKRFKFRYKASLVIDAALKSFGYSESFDTWHKNTIKNIKNEYKESESNQSLLSEGQAQKWLNMTIKYLYTFYILLEEDPRLKDYKRITNSKLLQEYKIVIDSSVITTTNNEALKGKGWSTLKSNYYEELNAALIDSKMNFCSEYESWIDYKNQSKLDKPEKNTYAWFVKNEQEKNTSPVV